MPRKILPRVCKRMKILLSYAHEDFALAEKIAQAPRAAGHRVFFDKHNMVGSEDFNARIRDEINSSERFVFLLSRAALDPGGFTLTELRFARERWPGAARCTASISLTPRNSAAPKRPPTISRD